MAEKHTSPNTGADILSCADFHQEEKKGQEKREEERKGNDERL